MNKDALERAVASKLDISIKDGKAVVDAVFGAVLEGIVEHDVVSLGALGKLAKVERAARKGRNPQDGTEIDIPAKTSIKLKPSKNLKESVNQ
jgi:DNA-binding protein HU-beta